jgi:hypothetical protein
MSGGVCHNPSNMRIIYLRLKQCGFCVAMLKMKWRFRVPVGSAFFFGEKSVAERSLRKKYFGV